MMQGQSCINAVGILVLQGFRTADAITEHCKHDMQPVPGWVSALGAPARFLDSASDAIGAVADVSSY